MGTRKRFSLNRVCSSDQYMKSRNIHRDFVRNYHEEHTLEIKSVTESISIKKKCYVSCFGELVEITEAEATRIEQYIKVIRK